MYDQLRSDVLSGKLKPGEKHGAEALRTRFNTGSSSVREALNRLLSEGFVALEEQKGFRVAPVSRRDDWSELMAARCWIDGTAVTESIKRFDMQWEEQLVLALHRLSKSIRGTGDAINPARESRHKAFHLALVGGCGARWIVRFSEHLFDASERYRVLASAHVPERGELEAYRAIVDACFERSAERAVALLRSHYGQTFKVIDNSTNLAPTIS